MKLKSGSRVKCTEEVGDAKKKNEIGTIIDVFCDNYLVQFDNDINGHYGNEITAIKGKDRHCWWCVEKNLEPIKSEQQQIVIKQDGKFVTAYMGKKQGKAVCCDKDEFDLYTGAKLALDRLFDKEEKKLTINDLHIGDRVRIKSRAELEKLKRGARSHVTNMERYCGETTTVKNTYGTFVALKIDDGTWAWFPNMLEKLED